MEMAAGAPACNPSRSGIFNVRDKRIVLHVGLDVQNDLTCMVKANAILMGCSSFGQTAGILSEGLKFFSVGCEGSITGPHLRMATPLVSKTGSVCIDDNELSEE